VRTRRDLSALKEKCTSGKRTSGGPGPIAPTWGTGTVQVAFTLRSNPLPAATRADQQRPFPLEHNPSWTNPGSQVCCGFRIGLNKHAGVLRTAETHRNP
jgi:hypothetical protein